MALCKDITHLRETQSTVFDTAVRPGTHIIYEGIYRCMGCDMELAAIGGKPLKKPDRLSPCMHRQWRLLVAIS